MSSPSKSVKPKHSKLDLLLKHQNYEGRSLMKTAMPKPDSMPSMKLAQQYNNVLNMYIRNHLQRRSKTLIELQATLLDRKVKALREMSNLLLCMKVKKNSANMSEWVDKYNKYNAVYGD